MNEAAVRVQLAASLCREDVMPHTGLRIASEPSGQSDSALPVATPIRELLPYKAVSSLEHIAANPDRVPHKIDWNEATVPPSPKVIEAITAFLGNAHHLNWCEPLKKAPPSLRSRATAEAVEPSERRTATLMLLVRR